MISYGRHDIDRSDIESVIRVLKSDWLTTGPEIELFEKELAHYVGVKHVVVVNNATSALMLAVKGLDFDKGAEGITSPITFVASPNAMVFNEMIPIFADIDPKTLNIDPKEIAKHITQKTGLLMPVHLAGLPCDMNAISTIARTHTLRVIEDASHAIGGSYANGKKVGSCCYSDATVFSFHAVKTITTGEGGAITTNNTYLYNRLKVLRSHGIEKNIQEMSRWDGTWSYEMQDLSYNFRMTDIQAALGRSQLKRLNAYVKKRNSISKRYVEAFRSNPLITLFDELLFNDVGRHLFIIQVDFESLGKTRAEVVTELSKNGIGTQVHYIPVHMQPYYRKRYGLHKGDYPNAELYYKRCLTLPLYPAMTDSDIQKVIQVVQKVLR